MKTMRTLLSFRLPEFLSAPGTLQEVNGLVLNSFASSTGTTFRALKIAAKTKRGSDVGALPPPHPLPLPPNSPLNLSHSCRLALTSRPPTRTAAVESCPPPPSNINIKRATSSTCCPSLILAVRVWLWLLAAFLPGRRGRAASEMWRTHLQHVSAGFNANLLCPLTSESHGAVPRGSTAGQRRPNASRCPPPRVTFAVAAVILEATSGAGTGSTL